MLSMLLVHAFSGNIGWGSSANPGNAVASEDDWSTSAELSADPCTCMQVHASRRALPLATDVALGEVARMTTGFTGADLANLVNEAALLAGRGNKGEAAGCWTCEAIRSWLPALGLGT